jgi:histidinol-phosphate phosphatase family protein
MRRAVFVDRDGVICHNRSDHVKNWEEFVFLPGAVEAMVRLARLDVPIVVVTNQAVINRGLVPAKVVEEINDRMVREIEAAGGRIDRVVYCPHRPDEHCSCRKPQPGMLLMAAQDLGLDLGQSYLIGDAATDMQAGQAVGCHCYMVLTGRGRRQLASSLIHGRINHQVTWNLAAATKAILQRESKARRKHPRYALGMRSGW